MEAGTSTMWLRRRVGVPLLLLGMSACVMPVDDGPPEDPVAVNPLSKVTVHNESDEIRYARMNWPDGFIQVSRVEPGRTQWLSGAIGTSGFPRTIDILDAECEVLESLEGLPAGSAALITVGEEGARLQQIFAGWSDWTVAESVFICGASID
jgi:hypothetical protein